MPKHLADLYQASIKEKKYVEINFVNHNDRIDTPQLDISDFLENPEESFNNKLGNFNVHISYLISYLL